MIERKKGKIEREDMKKFIDRIENEKNRNLVIGVLIFVIILQIITRIYFGCQKEYFHMDEMYSYGLMNYHNINITDNEDFYDKWHTKEYYQDYIEINSDEVWNLLPVYENQKNDVHPPLFYLLLRVASMFTIDGFSKWTGIILNMILFICSSILVYLISKKVFRSKVMALLVCAFNGFTFLALSSTIYIRMYELANLNILLLVYLQLRLLDKQKLKLIQCVPIIVALLLGGLTHYYFFIFAAVIYMMYAVKCIREKSYHNLRIYTGVMIVAAMLFLVIFPHAINHVFFSYRGLNGGNETGYIEKLIRFADIIVRNLSGYFLVLVPVVLYIMTKNKEKKSQDKKEKDNIDWLFLPFVMYFLIVVKNAPYIELRYMIPIGSVAMICFMYFIWKYLKQYYEIEKVISIIAIFGVIMIIIPLVLSCFVSEARVSFTYSEWNHIADKIEEKGLPIVYILDKDRNRFLDDMYLLTLVDRSIVIDSKRMEEFKEELEKEKHYIFICNNEAVYNEFLKGKNAIYLQHMNACDIWEITNE